MFCVIFYGLVTRRSHLQFPVRSFFYPEYIYSFFNDNDNDNDHEMLWNVADELVIINLNGL